MAIGGKRFLRRPHGAMAWRDVLVALAIKLSLLACLYLLFFSPSHRPPADAAATAGALMGVDLSKDSR